MINTIKKALEESNLNFQTIRSTPEQTVYKLGMTLDNGRCDTFIDIRTGNNQVLIYTTLPTTVPVNHRVRVAEFLTRANYGLVIGNFELDFEDGEVRYKATYIYDDTFPNTETIFMRNLFVSFNTMDKYLPGVMSVIYANILPNQAITQIENTPNSSMN